VFFFVGYKGAEIYWLAIHSEDSQRHITVGLASCACMRSLASVCSFASRGWVTLHVLLLV
jgi:hypothetical protein